MKHFAHHHHGGPRERRHGVQVGAQDRGHLREEDVAQHPAADPGEHAEQGRHDRAQPEGKRLLGSRDCEERQAKGVEEQDGILQPFDEAVPRKRDRAGDQRRGQVSPVAEGRRRHRSDEHVPRDAAGGRGRERQHQDAEEIQLALDSRCRSAEREHKGSHDVDHQHQRTDERLAVHARGAASHARAAITIASTPASRPGSTSPRQSNGSMSFSSTVAARYQIWGAAKTMRMRPSSMETTEKHHPNHFRKWMSVHDYIKPGLKYGPSGSPRGFLGWTARVRGRTRGASNVQSDPTATGDSRGVVARGDGRVQSIFDSPARAVHAARASDGRRRCRRNGTQGGACGTDLSAQTDAAGRFSFSGPLQGPATLHLSGPGVDTSLRLPGLDEGLVVSVMIDLSRDGRGEFSCRPRAHLRGSVGSVHGRDLRIAASVVHVDDDTSFDDDDPPALSQLLRRVVDVDGFQDDDGSIRARRIHDKDKGEIQIEGLIAKISGRDLVVDGKNVHTDNKTKIEICDRRATFADLAVGQLVEVEGTLQGDGSILARSIEVEKQVKPPPAKAPAAPIADAGLDQAVASGAFVTLDASASSDPAGLALSFAWTQTAGSVVALSSATIAQPTFGAP